MYIIRHFSDFYESCSRAKIQMTSKTVQHSATTQLNFKLEIPYQFFSKTEILTLLKYCVCSGEQRGLKLIC